MRYRVDRTEILAPLIGDFVLRERRLEDQPALEASVYLRVQERLERVATVGTVVHSPRVLELVGSGAAAERAIIGYSGASEAHSPSFIRIKGLRSALAVPFVKRDDSIGILILGSSETEFAVPDVHRCQILAALITYELRYSHFRTVGRSALATQVGQVLRRAREELGLTQSDIAASAQVSRIALSLWESGGQPPSPGQLRRWCTALGLLGGGYSELITIVDASSRLADVLQGKPERMSELSPEQFEALVADRLDQMGYAVERTGVTNLRDGGIDLVAVPKGSQLTAFLLAVQVKHHRGPQPTGRDAVDRLLAWQNSPFRLGLLVTNTRFTRDAIWVASRDPAKHFLRLRDFADLARWLRGTFTSELDWREIPDRIELAPGITITVPKPQFTDAGVVWPLARKNETLR